MFCIKCGEKLATSASFCHGCGTQNTASKSKAAQQMLEPGLAIPTASKPSLQDAAPNLEMSSAVLPKSKSKALWICLVALMITLAVAFLILRPALDSVNDNFITVSGQPSETPNNTTALTDSDADRDKQKRRIRMAIEWDKAIDSNRITDFGKFVEAYPDSDQIGSAEALAFDSLRRQNSYEAFIIYKKYFGNARLSGYEGPRTRPNPERELNAAISNRSIEQIAKIINFLKDVDPNSDLVNKAYEAIAEIVKEDQSEATFLDAYKHLGLEGVNLRMDGYVGPFRMEKNGYAVWGLNLEQDSDHPMSFSFTLPSGTINSIASKENLDTFTVNFSDGRIMTVTSDDDGDEMCRWNTGISCDLDEDTPEGIALSDAMEKMEIFGE